MKLYKVITVLVNGYDGDEIDTYSYQISEKELVDETPVTREDVVDADSLFLTYVKYECLGDISVDEIQILTKFNIIKL